MEDREKIAITMGDPAGVGPEIIVKALSHVSVGGILYASTVCTK